MQPLSTQLNPVRNLGVRLGLMFGISSVILSLLLCLSIGATSTDTVQHDRGELLAEIAMQMSVALDRGMFERAREIQGAAQLDLLRDPTRDTDARRALLEHIQATYPEYAWIGFADTSGNVIVSTDRLLEGTNVGQRPWFQHGKEAPFVGDVHDAKLLAPLLPNPNGEPLRLVDFSAPVRDRAGVPIGVLGAHLNWTWAQNTRSSFLQTLHKQDGIDILVLSSAGDVLLNMDADNAISEPLNSERLQAIRTSSTSYAVEQWPDGVTYLTGVGASTGYRSYLGLGWSVVARQSTTTAFAAARELQGRILAVGSVLGLVFAALGWLIAHRSMKPLRAIAAAADQISQGDTTRNIPTFKGSDEVATVAASLHTLVRSLRAQEHDLKQLNSSLEQRINERTETLQRTNSSLEHEINERVRVEHALRDSQERFRRLSEASFEGIVISEQGCIVDANSTFATTFGYSLTEAQAMSPLEFVAPSHRELVARMIQSGDETVYEAIGQHRNGTTFPIEVRGKLVPYEGRIARVTAVRDISARKHAESALHESEKLLELFFAQSLDGFFFMMLDEPIEWDEHADHDALLDYVFTHQRITKINEAMLAQYGGERNQFIGLTVADFFKHDPAYGKSVFRQLFNNGRLHIETDERKFDGSPMWIEGDYICLYDEQGRVTGHFGVQRDVTERKRAEQALRQKTLEQDALLRSIPALVYFKDRQHRYVAGNQMFAEATGVAVDQIAGKTDFDLFSREAAHLYINDDELVMASGMPHKNIESTVVQPDGRSRWLRAYNVPYRDPAGTVIGMVGVAIDVTEQKRAEEAVRTSERRFRAIFDQTFQFMGLLDPAGNLREANQTALRFAGLQHIDVVGQPFWTTPWWADTPSAQQLQAAIEQAAAGKFVRYEVAIRGAHGTSAITDFSIKPVLDEAGNVILLLAEGRDISERKQAERELKTQRDFAQQVMNTMGQGLTITDAQGHFEYVNPAYARMLGRATADLIGQTPWDLTHTADHAVLDHAYAQRSAEQSTTYEARLVHADGSLVYALITAVPRRQGDAGVGSIAVISNLSDRKRVEDTLREREQLLRLFVQHTPAAVAMFDRNMRYMLTSERWLSDNNITGQNIIGRSHYDVFPDLPARWNAIHQRGLAGEVIKIDEDAFTHADGSIDWVRWQVVPWHDVSGAIGGILMFTDIITERKHAQEALRESEARYRTLVENLPLGIFEIDRDGRLLSMNPSGRRTLGLEEYVDQQHYLDVIPRSNRANMASLLAQAFAAKALAFEHSGLIDGQPHVFTSTLTPRIDADGSVRTVIGMLNDITEQRHMQLEIEMERYRLDAVLESSNEAILMVDLGGRLALVNQAFEQFFGVDASYALGTPVAPVMMSLWDNVEQPAQFFNQVSALAADASDEVEGELAVIRPAPRTLVWYSGPVHSRAGTSLGRVFVFRDATRERQADRMKTEFIATVSHELRTPLTSIKGFVDLIRDGDAGPITPEIDSFLEIVQSSADRLVQITNDVLETARLESGKIRLKLQPLAIDDAIHTTIRPIQPLLDDKQQLLTLDIAPALPPVVADRERVIQVLTNLLSNAHKYTGSAGAIHVSARLATADDQIYVGSEHAPDHWLIISVRDTGMGIKHEDQALLFTRFYRSSNPKAQDIGGTGLGLHITRSLVELHGGAIWINSVYGQGSTFSFSLPIADAPTEDAAPPAALLASHAS